MSLTTGRGPLSPDPAGRFSAPVPRGIVYAEPLRRRIRGIRSGMTVVDSEAVHLVHRPGRPPTWAFPPADVGDLETAPDDAVPGHVSIAWGAVDEWYEEGEPVVSHPRNPFHRIDCLRTHRRLRVEVGGTAIVDTTETIGLYETALAPRLYVARDHVRTELLTPSDTTSYCPYKGTASWWHAVIGGAGTQGRVTHDVAWSYEDPVDESTAIRGLLCFDPARAAVHEELPDAT